MNVLKNFISNKKNEKSVLFTLEALNDVKKKIEENLNNKILLNFFNITTFKKFLKFILHLYCLTDIIKDLDIIENIPLHIIENFIPQLVGFYIIHKEYYPKLSEFCIKFIFTNVKKSIKFAHLVFLNLLSCKNIYKKYLSLLDIKKLMIDILDNWEFNFEDFKFKNYESIFVIYTRFDEFIEKNLIFSISSELIHLKNDELTFRNLDNRIDENSKWFTFISTLNFINDLIYISEILKNLAIDLRMKVLLNFIHIINRNLPSNVYIPVDTLGKNECIKQNVLKICDEKIFCLSSKEKVPYHILIEVEEIDERKGDNDIILDDDQYILIKNLYNNKYQKKKPENNTFFSKLLCCIYNPTIEDNLEIIPGLYGDQTFNDITSELLNNSEFKEKFKNRKIVSVIVKGGEDMRQDQFVSQIINIFLDLFKKAKLNIFLKPINIITTGRGGIIQTLTNSLSLIKITNNDGCIESLKHYFTIKYGKTNSENYKLALKNFIKSMVGYSLLCYFLEIKDRHNANILLDDDGSIIHIDFGFLLNHSPGNVNFEKVPFKLTQEYVDLMDGLNSKTFYEFRELFYKGFLALRDNYHLIISFIEIFIITNSDLPCFIDKEIVIENVTNKFFLYLQLDKLREQTDALIDISLNNWRTKLYDNFQNYCVGLN